MKLFDSFSVQKLYDDLDYWIHIGVGGDIVELKDQRHEYQHLVKKHTITITHYEHRDALKVHYLTPIETSKKVLEDLREELKLPWYKRPTFWHLVLLNIMKNFRILKML